MSRCCAITWTYAPAGTPPTTADCAPESRARPLAGTVSGSTRVRPSAWHVRPTPTNKQHNPLNNKRLIIYNNITRHTRMLPAEYQLAYKSVFTGGMMGQQLGWTLEQWRQAYSSERLSPREALHSLRAELRGDDPAWIHIVSPGELDQQLERLEALPDARALPLYGIPFVVKDNIDVA